MIEPQTIANLIIVVLFVSLDWLLIRNMRWARGEMKYFLRDHPAIADAADLEAYKAMVRQQMYAALAQLGLGIFHILLCIQMVLRFAGLGLMAATIGSGLFLYQSRQTYKFEQRARSLAAATPELAAQHQQISQVWLTRPLPNF